MAALSSARRQSTSSFQCTYKTPFFAFRLYTSCAIEQKDMKQAQQASAGDWVVLDTRGRFTAYTTSHFAQSFRPVKGKENEYQNVCTVTATAVGSSGSPRYIVRTDDGVSTVWDVSDFHATFQRMDRDGADGTATGGASGGGTGFSALSNSSSASSAAASARERELETFTLTTENANVCQRKERYIAHRVSSVQDIAVTVMDVGGTGNERSEAHIGDWIVLTEGSQRIATMTDEQFRTAYKAVPNQPGTYRETEEYFAKFCTAPFVATGAHAQMEGRAGDVLLQTDSGEQCVLSGAGFSELYDIVSLPTGPAAGGHHDHYDEDTIGELPPEEEGAENVLQRLASESGTSPLGGGYSPFTALLMSEEKEQQRKAATHTPSKARRGGGSDGGSFFGLGGGAGGGRNAREDTDDGPERKQEDGDPTTSTSQREVLWEGYIFKKGERGMVTRWKKRWFTLYTNGLDYREKETSTAILQEVELLCAKTYVTHTGNSDVFILESGQRVYYLQCANTLEHRRMVERIQGSVVTRTIENLYDKVRSGDEDSVFQSFRSLDIHRQRQLLTSTDEDGVHLLHLAAESGSARVIDFLVGKDCDVGWRTYSGDTPLHIACATTSVTGDRKVAATKVLLQRGADPCAVNDSGETPLHLAAYGTHEQVKLLLQQDVPVNIEESEGRTPLMEMARLGNLEALRLVIDAGADVYQHAWKDGSAAIFLAAQAGQDHCCRELLKYDLDINETDFTGNTPLLVCVSNYVRLCAQRGGDHNGSGSGSGSVGGTSTSSGFARAQESQGGLHYKFAECISALLQAGAQPDCRNARGFTPFLLLCDMDPAHVIRNGHLLTERAILALVDAGANVSAKLSERGRTAIHFAAAAGNHLLVQLLIQHSADPNELAAGFTPLDIVRDKIDLVMSQEMEPHTGSTPQGGGSSTTANNTSDNRWAREQQEATKSFLENTSQVLVTAGGMRRAHADIPVERDTGDIQFMPTNTGTVSVKAATRDALLERFTSTVHIEVEELRSFVVIFDRHISHDELLAWIIARIEGITKEYAQPQDQQKCILSIARLMDTWCSQRSYEFGRVFEAFRLRQQAVLLGLGDTLGEDGDDNDDVSGTEVAAVHTPFGGSTATAGEEESKRVKQRRALEAEDCVRWPSEAALERERHATTIGVFSAEGTTNLRRVLAQCVERGTLWMTDPTAGSADFGRDAVEHLRRLVRMVVPRDIWEQHTAQLRQAAQTAALRRSSVMGLPAPALVTGVSAVASRPTSEAAPTTRYKQVYEYIAKGISPPSRTGKGPGATHWLDLSGDMTLSRYRPLELAQQLTLIVHCLLVRVPDREFLSLKFSKVDACPRFAELKSVTTRISFGLISEILRHTDVQNRARFIELLIRVGELLSSMNNYDVLLTIVSVLGSTPIHRLKQTWQRVEKLIPHRWEALQQETGVGGRNLERRMMDLFPPCVPTVGIILKNLINYSEEPDLTTAGLVHFHKARKLTQVMGLVDKARDLPYTFSPDLAVMSCLLQQPQYHDEDACWDRSIELEGIVKKT